MASGWYTNGILKILDGTFNLGVSATNLKALLVAPGYTYNPDHDVVSDVVASELSATNYVRKTATLTPAANDGSNRVEVTVADITWTALGGASNGSVGAIILYKQVGGSQVDASDILIAYLDLADFTTNGSDFTADMAASGGNLRINV
jgi:hypothetical protein